MKVRPRSGRSGWAEKRLRQVAEEQETYNEIKADRIRKNAISHKRSGSARAEWNRSPKKYQERFGNYSNFYTVYSTNYDEAMYSGKNTNQAKFAANKALRNATMTKAERNAQKRRQDYKGINRDFWQARREQGNKGSGKFSFNGFTFLRYDKLDGADYLVFQVNADWEFWDPISPKPGREPFFKYVGNEAEAEEPESPIGETSPAPIENSAGKTINDMFTGVQPLKDENLENIIKETFGEDGDGGKPANSIAETITSIPTSVNGGFDNPLAILAATKKTKRRSRKKRKKKK